jgi:hypothetical protein
MGWLTNSISGFAGNYAGNTASQFYANGGSNNYSSDQAFQSGLWGAAVNHGENTASEGTSYLLPAGNPLVKSAVDFGVSAADSAASERIMTGNSNSDPSQGGYH